MPKVVSVERTLGGLDVDAPSNSLAEDEILNATEREFRSASIRCRILQNELADTKEDLRSHENHHQTALVVLEHMQTAKVEVEERLAEAQAELQICCAQVR